MQYIINKKIEKILENPECSIECSQGEFLKVFMLYQRKSILEPNELISKKAESIYFSGNPSEKLDVGRFHFYKD